MELEKALYAWFVHERNKKKIITNELLKLKALELNRCLNGPKFLASDGWVSKFKKRYGIRISVISGEKLSCDDRIMPDKFQQTIQENSFLPEQIYNCDETTLVYKGFHRKQTLQMRKNQHLVNATGIHKLDLMLNGIAKKPRCFKNFEIPTDYPKPDGKQLFFSKNGLQIVSFLKLPSIFLQEV